MRKTFSILLLMGYMLASEDMVNSLQCWKCISDDCEGDMESNNKAEKVTCKIEENCMKVLYKFQDNSTIYESVIKTCSSGQCEPTSLDEFNDCLESDHDYLVRGCSRRLCCHDNMCNHGGSHSTDLKTFLGSIVIVIFNSISYTFA